MIIKNIYFYFVEAIKSTIVFVFLTLFELRYLGPWKKYIINWHIKKRKNKKFKCSNFNDIKLNSAKKIATEVEKKGYSLGGMLNKNAVNSILNYCNNTIKYDEKNTIKENIVNPHLDSTIINDILHSDAIYNAVKKYLNGAEPILYDSALWIRKDETEVLAKNCSREFHYDISDYKALAIFIYLTDVDQHSAPHVIIKNSHNTPYYKKIFCKLMPAKKAKELYSDNIVTLTGNSGDIIFENLLCYHKRSLGNKKRIILTAHYNIKKEKTYRFEKTKKFILSLR